MRRICCIVGTRPEAVKMAPVVTELRDRGRAAVEVVATGQHRELLEGALATFGVEVDADLNMMRHDQSLNDLVARLLAGLEARFAAERPDMVLVQGDTASVLAAALACFGRDIPLGHLEAGLRTGNLRYPFPEEFNRRVATLAAALHFAPTERARDNLLAEGVSPDRVILTGNTVIDALLKVRRTEPALPLSLPEGARVVLLTLHRRENFGPPADAVFDAVLQLTRAHPDLHVVYPVHPNPAVRSAARARLSGQRGVTLCEPLDYPTLVALLDRCDLVLTDSGGLQEEAPALGKPVLVLRTENERPEGVASGVVKLIGAQSEAVVAEVSRLLSDPVAYAAMARSVFPYGDGRAAERIADAVERFLDTAHPLAREERGIDAGQAQL